MSFRLLAALLVLTLAPRRALADADAPRPSLQAPPKAPAAPPLLLATTPAPLPLPLPPRLQPAALERAHLRAASGRIVTFVGLGALAITLGVGVPLIVQAEHPDPYTGGPLLTDGVVVASLFGAIAGSALTVGPVLWQSGAHDEAELRAGRSDLRASWRARRILGNVMMGLAVAGSAVAIAGAYLWTHVCDECRQEHDQTTTGLGLTLAGLGVGTTGFVTGMQLLGSASHDQKMTLTLAGAGVKLTF